eukprot:g7499.t1
MRTDQKKCILSTNPIHIVHGCAMRQQRAQDVTLPTHGSVTQRLSPVQRIGRPTPYFFFQFPFALASVSLCLGVTALGSEVRRSVLHLLLLVLLILRRTTRVPVAWMARSGATCVPIQPGPGLITRVANLKAKGYSKTSCRGIQR